MGSRHNSQAGVDPHGGSDASGGRVPDPHRPVARRRWRARCRPGRSPALPPGRCGREGGALLAGGRVPDPHCPVVAGGGEPGAVRGDRHARHQPGVAGAGGALLAGGRIPDPHRPVPACRWRARCRPGRSPPLVTGPAWPVRAARCWPVAASQIRTVPSSPAVASQVPSGAIASALTGPGCGR